MSDEEILPGYVYDLGSANIRCGHAGEQQPTCVVSSLLATCTKEVSTNGVPQQEKIVGAEVWSACQSQVFSKVTYPIQDGHILDWDAFEQLWKFCTLHDKPKSLLSPPTPPTVTETEASSPQPTLLLDSILSSRHQRETLTQLMFEKFHLPAVCLVAQPLLALYAVGRITGLVVDCGYSATHVVPVHESIPLRHAAVKTQIAGNALTTYVASSVLGLQDSVFVQNHPTAEVNRVIQHYYVAEQMKLQLTRHIPSMQKYSKANGNLVGEILLSIPPPGVTEPKEDATSASSLEFTCPDGTKMTIDPKVGEQCVNALFDPSLVNMEEVGIPKLMYCCSKMCDPEVRAELVSYVTVAGGTALLPYLPTRIGAEFQPWLTEQISCRVLAHTNPSVAAWCGGSILSSLSTMQQLWITKQEYNDFGPSIIRHKCV